MKRISTILFVGLTAIAAWAQGPQAVLKGEADITVAIDVSGALAENWSRFHFVITPCFCSGDSSRTNCPSHAWIVCDFSSIGNGEHYDTNRARVAAAKIVARATALIFDGAG